MKCASVVSSIQLRPQPVGIYSLPACFLLLPGPASEGELFALRSLLSGNTAPVTAGRWRFYGQALAGNIAEAREAISGDGILERWNRFILLPDETEYRALHNELPAEMIPLLEAAGFAHGLSETRPAPGDLDGELRALVLLTAASWHLEHEQPEDALDLLEEALDHARPFSPLLAAQILHQMAAVESETSVSKAVTHYREAIRLAADSGHLPLRAELWLNLGSALQRDANGRRELLLEAAKAYQEALHCGLSLDHHPEMYALAQLNLALAYLMMPSRDTTDSLRMGIAIQSLREALRVFQRETHPEMWSSAQLNLANALQYIHSSHPEENLKQAVDIYEELLETRNRAHDPLGYARLIANQANALAHLGVFQPALQKLNEAHKLFHWHGEPEMAASVLELTGEINRRIEERSV